MKKYISFITISLFLILLFAPGCEVSGEARADEASLNTPHQKTCHHNVQENSNSSQKICYCDSAK